jgi:hypothetical protein
MAGTPWRMHLADHRPRRLGQQLDIDRVARGQVEDELLVRRARHPVGVVELHREELVRHMIPEGARPVRREDAAQLGQHRLAEQLRLGPDQHVA